MGMDAGCLTVELSRQPKCRGRTKLHEPFYRIPILKIAPIGLVGYSEMLGS